MPSKAFSDMFNQPASTDDTEGVSDEKPLYLEGYTAEESRSFL
jgi:hypothetical protein